jgi:hypothetical protein
MGSSTAASDDFGAVVLRGANVASYKFALAKSILTLAESGATSASLADLAVPFSREICELRRDTRQDQRLTFCSTLVSMADTITFRPDDDTSNALAVLTRDGTPVSTAVRAALIDAARRKAAASIRAEAEALATDEADRAEAAQVLRDMETLRAW